MRLALALGLVAVLAVAASAEAAVPPPEARTAAVCADYPNQAAAQRAADTRDADGDGIYCESLPCPCAGPGGATPQVTAPTLQRQQLPPTFRGKCRRGILPDRSCSPGRAATTDLDRICTPGYSERVRDVSQSTTERIYYEYGIRRHSTGQYEVDHIVPLELGGSNSIRNLYPEAAAPKPGFHQKDVLENRLHALVCSGDLKIKTAQRAIATNWVKAYSATSVGA